MNLLELRESRMDWISGLYSSYTNIITIKSNYPGPQKANVYTSYLVYLFYLILLDKGYKYLNVELDSEGLIFFFTKDSCPRKIKEDLLAIESEENLGRLVDLDIYNKDISLTRFELQGKRRQCYLCDKDAIYCSRAKSHLLEEVEDYFKDKILSYIGQDFSKIAEFAMVNELMRKLSLGTVTINSPGSHGDMDFHTFFDSANAISNFLKEPPKNTNFQSLRNYGIELEEAMFKATKGVNTHKGLIFALVIIYGGYLSKGQDYTFRERLKFYGQESMKDFETLKGPPIDLYKNYGIEGPRGEAASGYEKVFEVYLKVFNKNKDLDETFWEIAKLTEDSNLIHRGGIKSYRLIKSMLESNLKSQAEEMILKDKLSMGGSADILAITLVIWMMKVQKMI